ncbi:MsnO8 family LLM class oxidoreductase [Falsarthrobacter nasiphocae]|uniref:Luciferase family oxidoreductase group 1 n=1 Tax=Falsarthrobacter nasiphocae TaxID=189863 RepID=A0AAE4C4S9_9MICC|nr:MsnO8 family LLM class oxidoreductase [Falsarthrobacter nasiphocae]MDR6891666.1 luciferase family oxidoreductase group 1 [Falsarthrobacter nasiphocae]
MTHIELGILDLATVSAGGNSAAALSATTRYAQWADSAGLDRFWVAEHHNMPGVASTAPAVLMAHLAARTERIKVGSGGVMLPNHQPLVVAEQFALLEALHPGRVELGLGRAPGTDARTAAALRRARVQERVEDFPEDVLDVLGLFGDPRGSSRVRFLRATPEAAGAPRVWLLGSSLFSARLAGALGLSYSYAHHFGQEDPGAVFAAYRTAFAAGLEEGSVPEGQEPFAMLTTSVVTADTQEEAELLAGPARVMALNLRKGRPEAIVSPETAAEMAAGEEGDFLAAVPATKFVGTPDVVARSVRELATSLEVQAVMLSSTLYDADGSGESRIGSAERFLQHWRA